MSKSVPIWAGVTVHHVRRALGKRLHAAGIEDAQIDARHMVQAVLDKDTWLDPDVCLDADAALQLEAMCCRREMREPLAHILGSWGFWSLDLDINSDVLTPRPETERLVEIALEMLPPGPARILDLGTGSGAIILSLLSERPDATGIGVDLSPAALGIAGTNAKRLNMEDRVRFIEGNWDSALTHAPFDLVVSNPPYIASAVVATLEAEVRCFEPILALDGGKDGLDAYRVLLPLLKSYLRPGGSFIFEIGADQGRAMLALAQQHNGLRNVRLLTDLAGRDRVVAGIRN